MTATNNTKFVKMNPIRNKTDLRDSFRLRQTTLWRLQKLYQAFSNRIVDGRKQQFLIDAIRIPDVSNCREILRKLDRNYNFNTKRIVVDLYSIKDYDKFMSQIIDVGMNRDGYHYLLGTLDINGMNRDLWKSFTYGGVNITGFQLVKATHRHRTLIDLLEVDQQPSIEVALTVDAVAVLTTALVKISKDDSDLLSFRRGDFYLHMECSSDPIKSLPHGHKILEYILNVTKEGLSGKIAFDEIGNRKGYTLSIFHLSYRAPIQKVGYWEHGKGLKDIVLMSDRETEEEKPRNRTRIVTTIKNEPFVQLKKTDNGKPWIGNERFEGYCIDMMKKVGELANITYTLKLVNDSEYGSKENGSWNGLIGELMTGEADIALASLTITHQREEAVYFTKPYMNTGISIMIKKPEREKPGVFSFMDPLSLQVWGLIIGGFFAVSFILYMVGRFSPYEWQDEDTDADTAPSDTFSFINTLWFSLGALMQQGPDIFPRSLSGRVLASAWWFFTLITISSYTANLAAFLTFEKLTTPINSVDDLVKQSNLKYGIQKSGATYQFFESSRVPIYRQMFTVMEDAIPSVYVDSPEEGWKRVINERHTYAFLLESSSNNFYNQRKPCKTMKVGRNLDQKGYGLAMPKYSDLTSKLNIAVLELREKGFLHKLEEKWWYSKGECGNADGSDKGKNALNLSNVSGIFHILIGGLVLAMIISLSQIAFHAKIKANYPKDVLAVNSRLSNHNHDYPSVRYTHPMAKRVIIDTPPVITCTTSNGGEPHLIEFEDDNHGDKIISLDDDIT
ncbi:glutamate receptor 4-like isoform X2 [Ruditapes philippinarum]|uniref:glutamate receptor 4-like isoform X2 n=1 Tax=Ruditapes philippinarum TaxID=129788 RepID=UPI00295A8276|nr:glutamate receptor 4-like isoform X2 [Ruditapes philippinarum]